MKQRPIILSTPMVQPTIAGKKTQHRKAVKLNDEGFVTFRKNHRHITDSQALLACPYGRIGDQLWVRESWGIAFTHEVPENHPKKLAGTWGVPAYPDFVPCVVYKADGNFPVAQYWNGKFLSPLFMEKDYSRILLEITDIRVEQLRSITRGDAMAEGCPFANMQNSDPVGWYADQWESINGKKHPWAENPWVWVVDFKTVEVSA